MLPTLLPQEEITPPASLETATLDVSGMKCAGCVQAVERQLTQNPGVVSACVNLVTSVAVVKYIPDKIAPENLAEKLTKKGFPSYLRLSNTDSSLNLQQQRQQEKQAQIQGLIIAGILLFFSSIGHLDHLGGPSIPYLSNIWFHWGLATLALLLPGRSLLVDGWRSFWQGMANMNTLVGLGTFSAYFTSCIALWFPQLGWECFFDEPVMLLGFILLGRTLEARARNSAVAAIEALIALQPALARLIGDPSLAETSGIEIPVAQVRVGEWVRVLPGEKIPVDGEIVLGATTVDQSMLTGESIPVIKNSGDIVIAGTLNQSGAIALKTTRTGENTTLATIISAVEEAQTRKAPVQKLADTVAGYFAYGVMGIASLTFLFWYFIGTKIFPQVLTGMAHSLEHEMMMMSYSPLLLSLKLTIAVLVIACPCALGLATPTAILVGTSIGAERGLLIKGGDVLEKVHKLDIIVFDKTGTLTLGHPTVTDCLPLININSNYLLQIAATVESGTNHPLAKAMLEEAQKRELPLLCAQDFCTESGLGVSANIAGEGVLLGNEGWLLQHGIKLYEPLQTQVNALANAGKTVVYVAVAQQVAGIIALQDRLRPEAKKTVQYLQQLGIETILLTGDSPQVAQAIAQEVGINQVFAEVRPEEKVAIIQSLQLPPGIRNSEVNPPLTPPRRGIRNSEFGESGQGRETEPKEYGCEKDKLLQKPIFPFFLPPAPCLPPSRVRGGLPPASFSKIVAMVGDGINDAPALAQADIGISLQEATEVAIETADIVLMRTNLFDIVAAIQLSLATFNKIRQNLFWALGYNALAIPLAAGVLLPSLGLALNPVTAGAFMAFSSVMVVTNSLLLRRRFLVP